MYKKLKDLKDNNPEISDEYYELTKKLLELLYYYEAVFDIKNVKLQYANPDNPSLNILIEVEKNLLFSIHKDKGKNKNFIFCKYEEGDDWLSGFFEFDGKKLPQLIRDIIYVANYNE
jgi:hypothetical protein